MSESPQAESGKLLLVGGRELYEPLAQALAGDYRLGYVSDPDDVARAFYREPLDGILIEAKRIRPAGEAIRRRIAENEHHIPVILLTESKEPVPTDLVRELNAYHALPCTERSWGYVARSIVDVLGQRDLQRENAMLRRVVEHASDCILSVSREGDIQLANGAVVRTFGYARTELIGSSVEKLFPPDAIHDTETDLYSALQSGEAWTGEVMARRRDGTNFPVHVALSFSRDPEEDTTAGIIVGRDVTELQRLIGQLTKLSIMDDLTEIYNVRYFWARFRYELVRSRRYGHPLSVVMLDLDRFKRLNERYGHQVGDEVLAYVAQVMKANTREADVLARYGGEEFAVVLPNTECEGARIYAENMRRQIESCVMHHQAGDISVTVSAGVAALSPDIHTEDELLRRADVALHHAKHTGRNRVSVWSPRQDKELKGAPESRPLMPRAGVI